MTNSNHAPSRGHGLDGFYAALRRPGIVRGTDERWFAGVAGGIARWLGVDPLVVRAAFILFSIFFGIGVTLYLVLWLLMPDDRGRLAVERALKDGHGGSIFLLVITVMAVLGGAPWWGGDFHGARIFGFALLVLGAWWFLTRTDTGRDLMVTKPWRGGGAGVGTGTSTGNAAANAGAAFGAGSATGTTGTTGTTGSTGDMGADPLAGAAGGAGPASAAGQPWTTQVPYAQEPRERVRSIGFAGGLLVLGLALVSGVAAHQVATAAGWAGNPTAIGIAAAVGVLGLAIVIAGLAGRRAGGLAFFTIIGMAAAIATTAAPTGLTQPFQAGDQKHVVTTLAGDTNFQLGLGQMTVDLSSATDYAKTPASPDVVTATMGVGQLTIVVPKDVPVTVNARARLGEVDAPAGTTASGSTMRMMDDPSRVGRGGPDIAETLTLGPKGVPAEIVVDAELGMGQILVRSAS